MRRNRSIATVLAAVLLVAGASARVTAQEPGDRPDDRVGDRIEDAARSLRKGLEQAGEAIKASFAEVRDEVQGMSVEARIYGRLHWDKALTDADLEVSVENGVATLTGAVRDPAAKAKAVSLARDTVGVTRVVDQLSIAEAADRPRPTTTPTPRP